MHKLLVHIKINKATHLKTPKVMQNYGILFFLLHLNTNETENENPRLDIFIKIY